MTTFPFLSGVSTRPDVDALIKAYPPESIKAGVFRVSYDELRSHVGRCDGSRMRTILNNWERRLKREYRVVVKCESGFGYYAPEIEDVFGRVPKKLRSWSKSSRRLATDVSLMIPKDDRQRQEQIHHLSLIHGIGGAAKHALKQLQLPNTAPQQPVQIAPPKRNAGA